ncbi:PAS domain-containing protein, partial [Candidatus Poribacteria bacterium]|nr:PAS domain-containing protein [Candidatus Poribacteria bacterium]
MSTEYPRSTLDAVLAACTDHIYAYDAQGRYLYANPAGATALGMRPEEVTGRTWRELGMPAEAMEAFDELRAVVQRSGEPASQEMRFPAAEGVRQYMCTLKRVREEGLG